MCRTLDFIWIFVSLSTGAIANQAYATGNISQIQSVQHLVAENEKRQHIEMQYLTEIVTYNGTHSAILSS